MPAIILFNRGWHFSSDDLVFSSILVIFLRSLSVPFTLAPLIFWGHSEAYIPTNLLRVLYFGIAINIVQVIVRSALAIASSRGGISEVDKRRPVVPIFYLYLFLIVWEISIYSAAIYLEASSSERHTKVCFFLRVICISGLFLLVTNVIAFLLTFDSTGLVWRNHPELWCFEENDDPNRLNLDQARAVIARLWHRRIRCLSYSRNICSRMNPNTKPESHDAMTLVSGLVGQYFMTNLVASDVLAGLVLLRWQTYQWVGCGRRVPLHRIIEDSDIYDPVTDPPPHSNPPAILPAEGSDDPFSRLAMDWLSIRRLWIYSKFACAVYGQLLYVFSHHLSPRASFRLCKHIRCSDVARSCCTCVHDDLNHSETHPFFNQPDEITAGCCICKRDTCNIAVYQEVTGAPVESLVYYSSLNSVYQPPFLVSFDDDSEVILVTIRGTLSLEDVIVDMLAEGLSLSVGELPPDVPVGDIQGYYVHMGILTSARNLRDIILRLQLIEKARLKRPSYPLVVCGHSLGAGVASVLALLLKKFYPEVKGYAFSPPLGLMSASIARYCKSFVVSIVLGYDIVSRLSIPTLNDLKWRLLSALQDCKVPKCRLLSQAANIVGLNCLLPSFCRPTNKSIGLYNGYLDETCQYHLLHPRVFYPRPPIATSTATDLQSASGALENCGNSITDVSVGEDVASLAPRPIRYLEEGRSLFRWLRIKTDVLLRTNSSSATCGLLASAVKIPECSTTMTSDSTDGSETSGFSGDLVSMDTNVRFAGLVVHIVEVQDEVRLSGGIGVRDRPFEVTEGHQPSKSCHCPPVAVWTNSRQFQSILIHPRMLADHFPNEVTGALYRIFCATCKYQGQQQAESPNSSPLLPGDSDLLDGEALIRRLKRPLC